MDKPFLLVLCQFQGVPLPNLPASAFANLVKAGSGGLTDYWRDVSYNQLDMASSQVIGWYLMNYAYPADANQTRDVFAAEARRLASLNGYDLTKFSAVIAITNANVDGGDGGPQMVACIGGSWGQIGWQACGLCQTLVFTAGGAQTVCPAPGGKHDFSVSSAYTLGLGPQTFAGQDGWSWCRKCQGLNFGEGPPGKCPSGETHDNAESGQYRVATASVYGWQPLWQWCKKCQMLNYSGASNVPCAGGQYHDNSNSGQYFVSAYWNDLPNLTVWAHETGHCFGLAHSWSATPETEYGNKWDVMSAENVFTFPRDPYTFEGPGLCAPNLDFLSLLDAAVVWSPGDALLTGETIKLLALNHPSLGYMAAKARVGEKIYYVEFRVPDGWDQGLPRSGIVVNEVRSWQECSNCHLMTTSDGIAPGPCIVSNQGHQYAPDAGYLMLLHDIATAPPNHAPFTGQALWQWCRKCQALTFAGGTSFGKCVAGELHDHTDSDEYTLVWDPSYGGQDNWKWCSKCQGLGFAGGSSPGPCVGGGAHDYSQSADYRPLATRASLLRTDASGAADWQPGTAFLDTTRGFGVFVHSFGTADGQPIAIVTIGPIQPGWRQCLKCNLLAYGASFGGVCPADKKSHALDPHRYLAPFHEISDPTGQDQWRWCSKCDGMVFAGGATPGQCAAGGVHSVTATDFNYMVFTDPWIAGNTLRGWRWCSQCQGLVYAPIAGGGVCPVGGPHVTSTANFEYSMPYV